MTPPGSRQRWASGQSMCRLVQLSRVELEHHAHVAAERHDSFNRRRPRIVDFRSDPVRRSFAIDC